MYAEVSVVVDGAQEDFIPFWDETLMNEFIEDIHAEAIGHGYPTEIYVMYHDHDIALECECAQYVTDHHPVFSWNTEVSGQ